MSRSEGTHVVTHVRIHIRAPAGKSYLMGGVSWDSDHGFTTHGKEGGIVLEAAPLGGLALLPTDSALGTHCGTHCFPEQLQG